MFLKMLEKERSKRKWTQKEVADRIGVSRSAYANYERGKRQPEYEIGQRLADLFETSIDYLLGGEFKKLDLPDIELSDDELVSKYNVVLDGVPIEETILRDILAYVRVRRSTP